MLCVENEKQMRVEATIITHTNKQTCKQANEQTNKQANNKLVKHKFNCKSKRQRHTIDTKTITNHI